MERTKCELLVLIHPYKEEKEILKKVRRTIVGGEREHRPVIYLS